MKTIQLNDKLTFKMNYDEDCGYSCHLFDDLWQNVSFISNHRDYNDKGENDNYDIDDLLDDDGELLSEIDGMLIVPVSAYIHGGIALSLGSLSCPWDSCVFGLLLFKNGEFGENNRGLTGFIHGWSELLNNNVYSFQIEERTKCKHCGQTETKILDSCGGFYGYESESEMIKCMKEYINLDDELLEKIK